MPSHKPGVKGVFLNLKEALEIIGLTQYTGPNDLKKAFRTQAHRYHPDKNPDNHSEFESEQFKKLFESYQYCLKNLDVLARHFGVLEEKSVPLDPSLKIENLDDIFEDIFGFSRQGRVLGYEEPQPVYLSLYEFFHGGIKTLKLHAYQICTHCRGIGADPGTLARICRHCFGKGFHQRNAHERTLCTQCQGRGREMERPCQRCQGFGRLKQNHKQQLKIPAGLSPFGVYTLESFNLNTELPSQVFVEIIPEHNSTFQIDKYDLMCEYQVDFSKLHQDQNLTFDSPLGPQTLVLPAGAKSGDVLILTKMGLYKDITQTERGDLKITLRSRKNNFFVKWFRRFF